MGRWISCSIKNGHTPFHLQIYFEPCSKPYFIFNSLISSEPLFLIIILGFESVGFMREYRSSVLGTMISAISTLYIKLGMPYENSWWDILKIPFSSLSSIIVSISQSIEIVSPAVTMLVSSKEYSSTFVPGHHPALSYGHVPP